MKILPAKKLILACEILTAVRDYEELEPNTIGTAAEWQEMTWLLQYAGYIKIKRNGNIVKARRCR